MKKLISTLLITLTSVACISVAQANLITNGSFEENDVNQKTWRWFSADDVNGWSGSNIEIWDNYGGVTAVEGSQFAELNAHANGSQQFSIYQSVDTNIGNLYNLSFYYRARASNDEAFNVALTSNNTDFFSTIMDDHVRNEWSFFSVQFRALAENTLLTFTSLTPYAGTVGNFIDGISIQGIGSPFRPQASVDEPTTLAVLALCIAGLMLNRFRQKQ